MFKSKKPRRFTIAMFFASRFALVWLTVGVFSQILVSVWTWRFPSTLKDFEAVRVFLIMAPLVFAFAFLRFYLSGDSE